MLGEIHASLSVPYCTTTLPGIASSHEQDWTQEVLCQLPPDYEAQAHTMGAFVRARTIRCVGDLLRGLLAYVLCARSFRHLGAWALLIGLANVSHVAWHRRLRHARDYLLWLLNQCLNVAPLAAAIPHPRVILLDATRLKEPGGTGDDWRVHLGYDVLAGRMAEVKVHDRHTAEGLTLFDWQPHDLVVADRGYSRRGQLAHVLQAGAQVVVRLAVQKVPLLTPEGEPLEVVSWLKGQGSGQWRCPVVFVHNMSFYHGHLIACSLPQEAAEQAREKERKRACKQQRQVSEQTLYLCGWLLLFSSLSPTQWTDSQVLELYRARWQVELVFKRMKQVLTLAQLRGRTATTNEAIILVLLVAWSLLQAQVQSARAVLTQAARQALPEPVPVPPNTLSESVSEACVSSWTTTARCVQTLRVLVQGSWTFARMRDCLPCLSRYLCSRRRTRPHQESCIRRQLLDHLQPHSSHPSLLVSWSSP